MDSVKILSEKGLEQAQECLSLLKYSEGLVKRDIELARYKHVLIKYQVAFQ